MELTAQERLIQFIHGLTDEECEFIVSSLMEESCTIGDADCTAPKESGILYLSSKNVKRIDTGAFIA